MTDESRLTLNVENGVGHVQLSRPLAANAIDLTFAREFELAAIGCAESDVRVVYITALGRQFCVGGDLKSFIQEEHLGRHLDEVTKHLHAGIVTLFDIDAPVVVAVNGAVAGAGLGIIMVADLVFASASSTFLMAYTRLGLSPDGATSWFLPRMVGLRRALDMALTNRVLDANEALEWGLVSRVVEGDAENEAGRLVETLASGSTAAFGASARLIHQGLQRSLIEQLEAEAAQIVELAHGTTARENIVGFLGGRDGTQPLLGPISDKRFAI
jgi:2-(1,2-epoxy-1,2-dihydrophenyl)acetyl-CoA isomerase